MHRFPHQCPICGQQLTVTEVSCKACETHIQGKFKGCRFCALSPEESGFLLTFIKCRGSIKDVERELGISYPTVRAALDNLIASLGLADAPAPDEIPVHDDTLKSRHKGTPDTAKSRKEILKMLSEHRITADEAAKRLKELT